MGWSPQVASVLPTKFRYKDIARRLISIASTLLFSFPLFSPVLAFAVSSDANLPGLLHRTAHITAQ